VLRVADLSLRHDLLICSDEIQYGPTLDPDRRHLPLAAVAPAIAEHLLTLMATDFNPFTLKT
jgi:cystathionine beta-lyase